MHEIMKRAFQFEDFCGKLFKKYNFQILQPNSSDRRASHVDLIIEKNHKQAIVEIKFYTTTRANYSLLRKAILQVKKYGEYFKISNQVLIIEPSEQPKEFI